MTTTNAAQTVPNFDDALAAFVAGVQEMIDTHFAANYKNLSPNKLSVQRGKRYVKIVTTCINASDGSEGQRSVWGFIDNSNGDILKAAGWKAPAKHARGNIFSANQFENVNEHGPNYLR